VSGKLCIWNEQQIIKSNCSFTSITWAASSLGGMHPASRCHSISPPPPPFSFRAGGDVFFCRMFMGQMGGMGGMPGMGGGGGGRRGGRGGGGGMPGGFSFNFG